MKMCGKDGTTIRGAWIHVVCLGRGGLFSLSNGSCDHASCGGVIEESVTRTTSSVLPKGSHPTAILTA